MLKLRRETEEADNEKKKKALIEGPNPSFGYGGKFGVEKDRMDQSAVGHDYAPKLEKHASQKDYSTGFGGKFGIQSDRVDKVLSYYTYRIDFLLNYEGSAKYSRRYIDTDIATGRNIPQLLLTLGKNNNVSFLITVTCLIDGAALLYSRVFNIN